VPTETIVYFRPGSTAGVKIGQLTVTAGEPLLVWDLACVKVMNVDGVEVPVPPLKGKRPSGSVAMSDEPDQAVLVSDSSTACFVDELVVYGSDGPPPERTRLSGARVYALAGRTYEYLFKPAEYSIRGSGGTTRRALNTCQ
jgi:hypothetical protein